MIYLYEQGTAGTQATGNLSDGHGFAADDPPTDDVFRCTSSTCDWEGRGDFCEGDPCPECEDSNAQDT